MKKQRLRSICAALAVIGLVASLAVCSNGNNENGGGGGDNPSRTSYTLSFAANGGTGTPPAARNAQAGETITLPGNTTGMSNGDAVFGGWNTNDAGTGTTYSAGADFTMPNTNTTLYAKWNDNENGNGNDTENNSACTITFNANGGTGTPPVAVAQKADTWFYLPGADGLSKSGFVFGGWNTKADGTGTTYSADSPYTVTADVTLYAKWDAVYTITFNSNGGSAVANQTVVSGKAANHPTDPSRSGFSFGGWFSNAGLSTVYNFSAPVTQNLTLYAKWNEMQAGTVQVIFDSNGGSYVPSQIVTSGQAATRPADPSRSGYAFDNWYSNAALTTLYNFSTPVANNITIYAKWTAVNYTITFNSNGGSGVSSQSVISGQTVSRPADPTYSGYVFDSWYSDSGLYTPYSFSTPVTGNLTLYAKWNTVFTVTFNSNGGSPVPNQTAAINGAVARPAHPVRGGYIFGDWYSDSGLNTVYSFSAPVIANMTLYAKWIANEYNFTETTTAVTLTGYSGSGGSVNIPERINGKPVTAIADGSYGYPVDGSGGRYIGAFSNKNITSVTIPNSITTIGDGAFYGNQLTSVTIPNSITTIGDGAFYGNQLTSVTIPNSVTEIKVNKSDGYINGCGAFANNKLTSVTFASPSKITIIGASVFADNQLTSVTIPNSVTTIERYAFASNKLTSITIPSSVTTIGDNLYYMDSGTFAHNQLTSVTFASPSKVTTIGVDAFASNKLTSITIPNSVTTIGQNAFRKNKLTSVTIPSSVTTIGSSAFSNNELTSVTIPDSVKTIENGAFADNQLTSVTIPDSVKTIENGAFDNNQLTSVTIPDSVTTIGQNAFRKNKLTSVTIPNSVTTIENSAFTENQLTSVTIGNNITEIGWYAFASNQLTSVTIPSSVKTIGYCAFIINPLTSITIGANVTIVNDLAFLNGNFDFVYINGGKQAGTYTRDSGTWTRQ